MKKEKKKNPVAICSVAAWILLLLLQVTCTCKNYAGNFIPDPHTLLATLSIQYNLFVHSALPLLLLQVTYLKAWAMNMRVLFLKIISNTHFSDTVFDSLLPVKFAWNSKICKFMLPTMCQNKLSNTVPHFLLKNSRRTVWKDSMILFFIIASYLLQNSSANFLSSGSLRRSEF